MRLPTSVLMATALTVAAYSTAACSTSPGTAPSTAPQPASTSVVAAAAHGVEAPVASVPWSQIGPGWVLATWSPVTGTRPGEEPPAGEPTRDEATTTLYLVDPAGGRYPITTFPPPGDKAAPELIDWSGDGTRALFYAPYAQPPSAIIVDLHTGTQTTLPVPASPRFTLPDGKALLVSDRTDYQAPAHLDRIDLTGKHQFTYPVDTLDSPFSGALLSTPDGTRLVLGTAKGLALMGNDGTVGATLTVPDRTDCAPLRWWDGTAASTVLATCEGPGNTTQLWTVPIDGGAPTALTAPNDHQSGPDLGDGMAWQLPAGTFIQAAGACGVIYLAKLNPDGTTTKVDVPKASGSVSVLGANGDHLTVQARAACGPGQALIDFDPAANASTILLGPSVNGGGVIDAVAHRDQ